MSPLATGRAAVAGMLAGSVLVAVVQWDEPTRSELGLAVSAILLIAILVVPDVLYQWRHRGRRPRSGDEQ